MLLNFGTFKNLRSIVESLAQYRRIFGTFKKYEYHIRWNVW